MTKKELAIAYHNQKYNCAQAVAMAFAEEAGIDKELLFKVCEGCGLGMGGMEGTCGAVTGAVILAGLKTATVILKIRVLRLPPTSFPGKL